MSHESSVPRSRGSLLVPHDRAPRGRAGAADEAPRPALRAHGGHARRRADAEPGRVFQPDRADRGGRRLVLHPGGLLHRGGAGGRRPGDRRQLPRPRAPLPHRLHRPAGGRSRACSTRRSTRRPACGTGRATRSGRARASRSTRGSRGSRAERRRREHRPGEGPGAAGGGHRPCAHRPDRPGDDGVRGRGVRDGAQGARGRRQHGDPRHRQHPGDRPVPRGRVDRDRGRAGAGHARARRDELHPARDEARDCATTAARPAVYVFVYSRRIEPEKPHEH